MPRLAALFVCTPAIYCKLAAKIKTVKVDNLLGPYLYQYKKLSLPGIGVFTLADNAVLPEENAKIKAPIEGISFSAATGGQLDDSLIMFIKEQTGKMKALAEADLHSYIATAFQYLNIGKPYYFEGIGTLQKNKDNNYAFTAGTVIAQKTEEIPHRHIEPKRKSAFNEDAVRGSSFNGGKLILVLGILLTLGLIGWGGYYLYHKNTSDTETVQQTVTPPEPQKDTASTATSIPDSTGIKPTAVGAKDTTSTATPVKKDTVLSLPANAYTFIFEHTDKKARAIKRYAQLKDVTVLKEFNNKVAVATKDSISFTIYTVVNCSPADTARVKQQLNAWYFGTTAMKVKIEH